LQQTDSNFNYSYSIRIRPNTTVVSIICIRPNTTHPLFGTALVMMLVE